MAEQLTVRKLDGWWRFLPWLGGVVAIWCISGMAQPPIPEPLLFPHSDKLMHAGAYAVLASLALWGVRKLDVRGRAQAFAMSALYGGIDEVHQSFVPGRSSSVADVAADALGALVCVTLGASAFVALRRARRGQVRE